MCALTGHLNFFGIPAIDIIFFIRLSTVSDLRGEDGYVLNVFQAAFGFAPVPVAGRAEDTEDTEDEDDDPART